MAIEQLPSRHPHPDLTSVDVEALEELWIFLEDALDLLIAQLDERPEYWSALTAALDALRRTIYLELLRRAPRTIASTVAPETETERAAAWGR